MRINKYTDIFWRHPLYIFFARTDVSLVSIKTFSSVRKCSCGELESFYLATCLKLQSCCRKAAFRKLLSKQRPKGLFIVGKGQLLFHMHAKSQMIKENYFIFQHFQRNQLKEKHRHRRNVMSYRFKSLFKLFSLFFTIFTSLTFFN